MVDREKVVKGLEICICFGNGTLYDCTGCPYDTKELLTKCITKMQEDVLELLKEQAEHIDRLERDLAITTNNLNFYINGND